MTFALSIILAGSLLLAILLLVNEVRYSERLRLAMRAGEKGPAEKCLGKAEWYRDRLADHHDYMNSEAITRAEHAKLKAEDEAAKAAEFPRTGVFGPMVGEWPDELRRQGAAAEEEAFARIEASQPRIDSGPMWVEHDGSEMPKVANVIEVNYRDGNIDKGRPAAFFWNHSGADDDIVRWRQPWPEGKPYTGQGGVMIQCPGCTASSCECRP